MLEGVASTPGAAASQLLIWAGRSGAVASMRKGVEADHTSAPEIGAQVLQVRRPVAPVAFRHRAVGPGRRHQSGISGDTDDVEDIWPFISRRHAAPSAGSALW